MLKRDNSSFVFGKNKINSIAPTQVKIMLVDRKLNVWDGFISFIESMTSETKY